MTTPHESDDEFDLDIARRLRRLSTVPVDLAPLKSKLASVLPKSEARPIVLQWFRPASAVAASLLVLASLALALLVSSPRSVVASTDVLTDLYSHGTSMLVEAQDNANIMPCCVRQVEGKNVTCLAITVDGKQVMMAIGDGKHFKVPDSAGRRTINGVEYRYQSSGKLNMVMAVKNGAWICLMGEPDIDVLLKKIATLDGKQP